MNQRIDSRLVSEGIFASNELIDAVIASSALPMIYEPIRLNGRLWGDGAIIGNQPTRLAIGWGADVMFLLMVRTPEAPTSQLTTFIDAGLRALDLLITQEIVANLKTLTNFNEACERAAARLGTNPEEVEIDLGRRRYRYIKTFIVRPKWPLGGSMLDFSADTINPAILQGYFDASAQIESFLSYASRVTFGSQKRILSLADGDDPPNRPQTT